MKSRTDDSTRRRTKSLEQLVADYPHVQFFRDMLGMRQDAIREPRAHFERHWESIGVRLKLSFSAFGTRARSLTRTQKLLAAAKRTLTRIGG